MRKIAIWLVVGSCLFAAFAVAGNAQEKTAAAVKGLEAKWAEAMTSGNADQLEMILADKFVNTNSDGKVSDKKESITEMKSIKWSSAANDDIKVTVFGNTAIAVGVFNGKGTSSKGEAINIHERFTDTWMKMPSGKWQCIASHTSPIKS
jgi:ketosteroid isomerase-like protein